MSFLPAQLRHLDAQLDKLQIAQLARIPLSEPTSPPEETVDDQYVLPRTGASGEVRNFVPSEHAQRLKAVLHELGKTSQGTPPAPWKVIALLRESGIASKAELRTEKDSEHGRYEQELEWLLLSKAAIQTYGIALSSLVDQTLPLSEDLFYWDDVLASYQYTVFYLLQSFPRRTVEIGKDIYAESTRRLEQLKRAERPPFLRNLSSRSSGTPSPSHSPPRTPQASDPERTESWSASTQKFYGLVKNTIKDRAYAYRISAITPFSIARNEIRQKQGNIRKIREMQASAIGVLIGEGLNFEFDNENEEWRGIIERSVMLLENVLKNVSTVDHSLEEFEDTVFTFDHSGPSNNEDGEANPLHLSISNEARRTTAAICRQLENILLDHLPSQGHASKELVAAHGRPSLITRYWLPTTLLLLSSSTILRILVNRQADIETWIRDFVNTAFDFWSNWVIEPTKQIIGTIRHNEESEVALMSRKSLAADMDSLERMVVDFAIDNPDTTNTNSAALTDTQIESIRANVKQGDLTPVLRAYEHDLRTPFKGAVKGELIRALLIQIQKTKVDVEVAISGIDRLLKSQELVFGMISLTPGILISAVAVRWAAGVFQGRHRRSGKRKGQMLRRLRKVDKILTGSKGLRGEGRTTLDYKEHGLLLCEVHALRQDAKRVIKKEVWGEFEADLEELVDVGHGLQAQLRVLDRIRWAYGKAMN
ncbi:NCA2-domain-containing protein [Ascodesmis nigricans]|uniref:NCA2-domain-containing protein n=1 Tax=Ascodesmis nigricans TaxID=341454 RepID=A0A4S2N402_9PEZI|nr:NCA2-domain-containing protein [Ascodesmis nigricans]